MEENKETAVEQTEKKQMNATLKFWLLMTGYTFFAVVLPILVIVLRFDLFQKITSTTIGAWGILCMFILGWFAINTYRYINKGIKYSFATKCIKGLLGLPLIFGFFGISLFRLKDSIDLVYQVLLIIAASETVATFLNPLPKWAYEHGIEENAKLFDIAMGKLEETRKNK